MGQETVPSLAGAKEPQATQSLIKFLSGRPPPVLKRKAWSGAELERKRPGEVCYPIAIGG
jgi:hypothetical protein